MPTTPGTSPLAHGFLEGRRPVALLSLGLLRTVGTAERQGLADLGVGSVADLLNFDPVHRARLVVGVAEGRVAHDVDLRPLLVPGVSELSAVQLADSSPGVLRGVGVGGAQVLLELFDVRSVRQLAGFAPFLEAEALVNSGAEPFREPLSAPDELVPQAPGHHGIEISTARYASFARTGHVTGVVVSTESVPEADLPLASVFVLGENEEFGLGYLFRHRQVWKNRGTALGEIIHSLGLAPGESRNVAILDWKRQAIAGRQEQTGVEERLSGALVRRRALDEVTRAVAAEHQQGLSASAAGSAVTSAALTAAGSVVGGMAGTLAGSLAGGLSLGAAGLAVDALTGGSDAGLGTLSGALAGTLGGGVTGALVGSAAGAAAGSALAGAAGQLGVVYSGTEGARQAAVSLQHQLLDATSQNASSIRSLWSTVITEDSQQEDARVQTVNVTNYNHAHALTVEYFEVLQKYSVELTIDAAEPILYLPFKAFDFLEAPFIVDHWPILRTGFEDAALVDTFDHLIETSSAAELSEAPVAVSGPQLRRVDLRIRRPAGAKKPNRVRLRQEQDGTVHTASFVRTEEIPFMGSAMDHYSFQPAADVSIAADQTFAVLVRVPAGLHVNTDTYQVRASALVGTDETLHVPARDVGTFEREGVEAQQEYTVSPWPIGSLIEEAQDPESTAFGVYTRVRSYLRLHRYRFTRLLLSRLERAQIADVLRALNLRALDDTVALPELADPVPLAFTDGAVLLNLRQPAAELMTRLRTTDVSAPPLPPGSSITGLPSPLLTIAEHHHTASSLTKDQSDLVRRQDLSLPTSGVFAEAILGRSNAAEKLDYSRHIRWHELPIPHQAPHILATALQSYYQAPANLSPEVPDSTLDQQSPPPAAIPGAALEGILRLLGSNDLFRDMSRTELLTDSLNNLSHVARSAALGAGALSGEAAERVLRSATDLANRLAGTVGALTDASPGTVPPLPTAPPSPSPPDDPTPRPVPEPPEVQVTQPQSAEVDVAVREVSVGTVPTMADLRRRFRETNGNEIVVDDLGVFDTDAQRIVGRLVVDGFTPGGALITAPMTSALALVGEVLRQNAFNARCVVLGHHDRTGPQDHRLLVSTQRAEAAAQYLVNEAHVPAHVIYGAHGTGDGELVTPTAEGVAAPVNNAVTLVYSVPYPDAPPIPAPTVSPGATPTRQWRIRIGYMLAGATSLIADTLPGAPTIGPHAAIIGVSDNTDLDAPGPEELFLFTGLTFSRVLTEGYLSEDLLSSLVSAVAPPWLRAAHLIWQTSHFALDQGTDPAGVAVQTRSPVTVDAFHGTTATLRVSPTTDAGEGTLTFLHGSLGFTADGGRVRIGPSSIHRTDTVGRLVAMPDKLTDLLGR